MARKKPDERDPDRGEKGCVIIVVVAFMLGAAALYYLVQRLGMDRYQSDTTRPETLSGLQARQIGIWAYCERCQHSASIDIEVLLRRLPGSLGVPEVGKKLKCSECGKVEVFARPDWQTW